MPIARGPELLGLLAVGTSDPGDLDPEELLLLDGIAHLAGLALGNAERYCLVRDQGERMALLEQTKSRFLRIASHDLRSPLTVLLGYLSLISEGGFGPVSPELAEAIAVLETKVNEMTAMVGAMFDTALLEDDRLELRLEVTDLRVLAHRAVQRAGPLLAGGQRVSMHAPPEVVGVRVDADRVGSILANLLSNAVKYSPAGEDVECTVRCDGSRAEVEVRDHGIGIAAEHRDTLFTRFGRVMTATTAEIPGTGLGLHLARELARLHGGDITVESEPGSGSAFSLVLPACSMEPREAAQESGSVR